LVVLIDVCYRIATKTEHQIRANEFNISQAMYTLAPLQTDRFDCMTPMSYASSLQEMNANPGSYGRPWIDSELASGRIHGYIVSITAGEKGDADMSARFRDCFNFWSAEAHPIAYGETGIRSFYHPSYSSGPPIALDVSGKLISQAPLEILLQVATDDYRIPEELVKIKVEDLGSESKQSLPALIEALGSPDSCVRYFAAWALGKIGSEAAEAVQVLTPALKDRSGKVRVRAAYAIWRITGDETQSIEILVNTLRDSEASAREAAFEVLGQMGTDRTCCRELNTRSATCAEAPHL